MHHRERLQMATPLLRDSTFCFIVLRDIYPVRNCFPGASSTDVLFEWGET